MFIFNNIVKVFIIGLCASMIITGASAFYIVPKIMDEVASAKRQSVIQYQRASSAYEEADTGLGNRIDRALSNLRSVAQSLADVRATITESEVRLSSKIEEADNQINTSIASILQNNASLANSIDVTDQDLSAMIGMLVELDAEIVDLRMRQDELTLIQAGALPINIENINSTMNNLHESIGVCPTNVINRDDHLPDLKRSMLYYSDSDSGLHDVLVKFDIQEDGSVFLKDVGSDTASDNMIDAVQTYVGALVFEKPDNSFANCEMIVKLNIN